METCNTCGTALAPGATNCPTCGAVHSPAPAAEGFTGTGFPDSLPSQAGAQPPAAPQAQPAPYGQLGMPYETAAPGGGAAPYGAAPGQFSPAYPPQSSAPGGNYAPSSPVYGAPQPPEVETAPDLMSTWEYTWPGLLSYIPIVGGIVRLVVLCIWAFGKDHGPNRRNFARGNLILTLIGLGIAVLFVLLYIGLIAAVMREMPNFTDYL